MIGQFMNDREKDEEIVVTYFTKQYRNVPRMTTVKHKKTENNWPPGSQNRGPGVTMFIKRVPTVLEMVTTFIKKQVSFNKLKKNCSEKKIVGVLIGWTFDLRTGTRHKDSH
jgi:hypothetical protein